ncbi:MAG TPA: hypothetical protein VK466_14370 [Terriglobales bacterium]|nr:hypothetical protein [Terriglobales bacterium]
MDLGRLARVLGQTWGRREADVADEVDRTPIPAPLSARMAAEVRARKLLLRTLSPVQREEFESRGYFSVQVPKRGKFWILPSSVFNVLHAATGTSYCAGPRAEVPLSDLMLAQKLLLESDPDAFFEVANRRAELVPGRIPESLYPRRVLQARCSSSATGVRWSDLSMIPHRDRLR